MNNIQAGLLAAVPVSALGILYMLWRGKAMVEMVLSGSTDAEAMSDQAWFYLMLGALALAPFVFGLLSALVYGWVGNQRSFRLLALGLAVLFSVLALTSKTPMRVDKIVMNFVVALDFGLLVPYLVR